MQFHLFLPQMRMSFDRLIAVTRAAEDAGFGGIAGMDHLVPPGAEDQPMYEAMITNAWLAAHTKSIKVGSLVLCDALRHPAVLARQAVSLDHASNGRFELGIGWGSYTNDFSHFGVQPTEPRDRVQRLRETLQVLKSLWAGETVNFEGQFHRLRGAAHLPRPLSHIPILIGGAGPKTLALVREFADWWNLDIRYLNKYDGDKFAQLRSQVGNARVSIQEMVAYVPQASDRASVTSAAMRRFHHSRPVIGTGPELAEHFRRRADQGIERVYTWFCDFGQPETLAGFGAEVITHLDTACSPRREET
jgi:alkanesulfonate monooxygenase SsuD/methylene tetrahydromethanopterin reductase-like flavin-dependent oxidoreductase (luciferase family)